MACEASDVHLAIVKGRINVSGHRDHVPRDFLFRIVIAGEVVLNVAMVALHAQPGRVSAHDRNHFGSSGNFQDFKVTGGRRWWPFSLILFILRAQGQQEQQ